MFFILFILMIICFIFVQAVEASLGGIISSKQFLSTSLHHRVSSDVPELACHPYRLNSGESDVADIQVALHRAVLCHS